MNMIDGSSLTFARVATFPAGEALETSMSLSTSK